MVKDTNADSIGAGKGSKRKQIVVVNRYFWPETILINYISRWFVDEGYAVTVITGQPDYHPEAKIPKQPRNQVWEGVEIRRIGLFRDGGRGVLRNLNTQLFTLLSCIHVLFFVKPDMVWCTTIPPVLQPLLLRVVTRIKRCKFVYFLQDIYPEIIIASEVVKENWLTRLAFRVDNWTIRASDLVVTISEDMQSYLQKRSKSQKDIHIIRSFSTDEAESISLPRQSELPVRFVFAGNIGRFQNLDNLIRTFADVAGVQLVLLGGGREKERLMGMVEEEKYNNIEFHDQLSASEAYNFVRACDVGVVTLREGIYKYAYPAKTYTYLGAGVPLLVLVENECELSRVVNSRKIGRALSWSESERTLQLAIADLAENLAEYTRQVEEGTSDLWGHDRAREEWVSLISDLLTEESSLS